MAKMLSSYGNGKKCKQKRSTAGKADRLFCYPLEEEHVFKSNPGKN